MDTETAPRPHSPQHSYDPAFAFMHNGHEWVIEYQVSDDRYNPTSLPDDDDEEKISESDHEQSPSNRQILTQNEKIRQEKHRHILLFKKLNTIDSTTDNLEFEDDDHLKYSQTDESQEKHNPSPNKNMEEKELKITRLESEQTVLSIITKAEAKRIGKSDTITFLKQKGAEIDKILKVYLSFYEKLGLYEITFSKKPFGFAIRQDDQIGKNAIVSSINDTENEKIGMEIGSMIYEINGKRVDNTNFKYILDCIKEVTTPCYIVFKK